MTKRTTMDRLVRWKEMVEASKNHMSWYVNRKGHPLPKLPSQEYLTGQYLAETLKSRPSEIKEVVELVVYVGKERR